MIVKFTVEAALLAASPCVASNVVCLWGNVPPRCPRFPLAVSASDVPISKHDVNLASDFCTVGSNS